MKTGPGEPVDLGEIGSVHEKNWFKATPYSPASVEGKPVENLSNDVRAVILSAHVSDKNEDRVVPQSKRSQGIEEVSEAVGCFDVPSGPRRY
jgi:hypothetical protein